MEIENVIEIVDSWLEDHLIVGDKVQIDIVAKHDPSGKNLIHTENLVLNTRVEDVKNGKK